MVTTPRPVAPTGPEIALDPPPVRLPADWPLTDERLIEIAELNQHLLFERSAEGELQITIWLKGRSRNAESAVQRQLYAWSASAGGRAYAGQGYWLPDGAAAAPDASWIDDEQLARYDQSEDPEPYAPRFAVEIRSRTQSVERQQRKLQDVWIANGVQLAWLIDPYDARVWIYRAGGPVEELDRPSQLSGEDICPGLIVDLTQIWPPAE